MIDQAQLGRALGQLDAGTRALLDLSLRRAIPDDQVAKVLGVDAASIPPRRARGIAQLADMMAVPGPSELAALLIAIPDLPEEAWGVPTPEPFAGGVTAARRAKAFKRAAVAASPLVALGAVMAAVLVSSSSDHSGSGSGATASHGAGGGAAAPLAAIAPDARHQLPPGVQLSQARRAGAGHARRAARHHSARHPSGGAQQATLARAPVRVEHTVPVAFHPPATVPHAPAPVVHHHHAPSKPNGSPTPTPAPVQTPSQPVSTPAPTQPQVTNTPVQVSAPEQSTTVHSSPTPTEHKPYKSPPSQPNLSPPGYGSSHNGERSGGGSCHGGYSGSHDGSSGDGDSGHGYSHQYGRDSAQRGGGRSFSPPGLFRKRH
ncbi:MAG TPA: hypothetical protein VGF74_13860 [Thermoleophilaceae bacterium]